MEGLSEILTIGKEFFGGNQLLALAFLWAIVHYVLQPLSGFFQGLSKLFKPPEEGEKVLKEEIFTFMDAVIEALHERTFSSRGIERALKNINDTLKDT